MREIKYRFWNKKIGRMIDWETMKRGCDRLSIFTNKEFLPLQFCGLKDKNGKEIYEGDIVRDGDRYKNENSEVKFMNGAFGTYEYEYCKGMTHNRKTFMGLWWRGNIEIIGNIFENNELLEAK